MTDKHTLVERSIRHYLDRIELRTNGSGWNSTKTSGYTVAEVPEWALRQWLDRITALEAREAELVGVLERIDAEVGPENDWTEKLAELHTWTASAFLAGERVKDVEWHKAELRSFLCGMIGYLLAAGEGAAIARAKLAKARQSDEGE